ncbi:MAG: hypothetical protein LBI87_09015, partial [Candidatus Accumulibacter sp.]|nr:hypothetical protein [Accumulibacter sp.]
RLEVQRPNSFRHAFGMTPPSSEIFGLRRFAPEGTFLDSRFRGNDGAFLVFVVSIVSVVVTVFRSCLCRAYRG